MFYLKKNFYITLKIVSKKKKKKLLIHLNKWLKKRIKIRKRNLWLKKKFRNIREKKRKNLLLTKDCMGLIKIKYKKKYIILKKKFIYKRFTKFRFKKKFMYIKKFKNKTLKKEMYRRYTLKKSNKFSWIVKEFLNLWKEKYQRKIKINNYIVIRRLIKTYKHKKRWKWKKKKLLKLFYRYKIKKNSKLRLKKKLRTYWYSRKKIKLKKKKRMARLRKIYKIIKKNITWKIQKKRYVHNLYNRNLSWKGWKRLLRFFPEKKKKKRKYMKKILQKKKEKEKIIFGKRSWFRTKMKNFIKLNKIEWNNSLFILKHSKKKRKINIFFNIFCSKKLKLKKTRSFSITRNKFFILRKKMQFPLILWKQGINSMYLKSKNIKEMVKGYSANFKNSREKKKHESWEKTKQRIKNERKIKVRQKKKNIKKLKKKKIVKIKNENIDKISIKLNFIRIREIKKIFYRRAKIYFQKKKKHLQNSIFIKKKRKHKKLIFYVFKTKKWNIQLNNKTSKTFRTKKRTKKSGRGVRKNKVFYYLKNIQSGKWIRRRKRVFKLKETLKKFIKKINKGLPNRITKYFSNPNKKKKIESLETFSNNFINNINILLYRIGVFPSISLSIEAIKRNWFCSNFGVGNDQSKIIEVGDNISIFPSFEVYCNYIWIKRMFIKHIFTFSCTKHEFYTSKKPFLFFFIKLKKKNLIINNSPKDWIKLSYLRNLKLIP